MEQVLGGCGGSTVVAVAFVGSDVCGCGDADVDDLGSERTFRDSGSGVVCDLGKTMIEMMAWASWASETNASDSMKGKKV